MPFLEYPFAKIDYFPVGVIDRPGALAFLRLLAGVDGNNTFRCIIGTIFPSRICSEARLGEIGNSGDNGSLESYPPHYMNTYLFRMQSLC